MEADDLRLAWLCTAVNRSFGGKGEFDGFVIPWDRPGGERRVIVSFAAGVQAAAVAFRGAGQASGG